MDWNSKFRGFHPYHLWTWLILGRFSWENLIIVRKRGKSNWNVRILGGRNKKEERRKQDSREKNWRGKSGAPPLIRKIQYFWECIFPWETLIIVRESLHEASTHVTVCCRWNQNDVSHLYKRLKEIVIFLGFSCIFPKNRITELIRVLMKWEYESRCQCKTMYQPLIEKACQTRRKKTVHAQVA